MKHKQNDKLPCVPKLITVDYPRKKTSLSVHGHQRRRINTEERAKVIAAGDRID